MSKRDPRVRGAVETVREAFVMNDLDTILILVRKQEAVVKAAREWREAQDNEDPRIDALLDALAALDSTREEGS